MTQALIRTAVAVVITVTTPVLADEGMWTYDNPPLQQMKEKYGFEPSKAWLDHLRLASVRFMDGGSGSFVSPSGLMITNHHVGLGCIQNVSTAERDYVKNGFYANTPNEEPACPGYEVNVLVSFDDVTARVQGKVTPSMNDAEAQQARKATIAAISEECNRTTQLRCDVVTLYEGGEYHLYRYKKYTDVRLVFAPEQSMAFFGGDPDNFTFPRHDIDICLMRAYENGKPASPPSHLRWTKVGTREDDLVFVSGNPGSTSRQAPVGQLETFRDSRLPFRIEQLERRARVLREYAARGEEQRRRSVDQLYGYENSLKALEGYHRALLDERAMARKKQEEQALRAKVAADPELARATGDPWASVAAIQRTFASRLAEVRLVTFEGSNLLGTAGQIVQYVAEVRKPNGQRLEEFGEANLDSLRNELLSPAPVYPDLEEVTLTEAFQLALDKLGPAHPFVKAALNGQSPAVAAHAAVAGTRLADPVVRRVLLDAGEAGVEASTDSMILLARRLDPLVREVRHFVENDVDAPMTGAMERIAKARWAVYGKTVSPDATFTLRLSYGTVKSYPDMGTTIAPFTTLHGLYDRSIGHDGRAPWALTQRWLDRKDRLQLATKLNFVSTNDIIGGNSGSPVVDRAGDFVGIVFDTNIQGLAWDHYFDDAQGRTVSVDARGILEVLANVYDAHELVRELAGS